METKSYVLNSTIQMIDINNDYNKFQTIYNITCDNLQDDFEYAIVSQKRLDEKQFQFKKAIGYMEDSFTQTDDTYTDWYLVLKAPKDTPCSVMINITSLDEPKTNTDVEYFDDVVSEQQSPPSRPPKRRPISKTRIRTKPIVYEYENEFEDDEKETKTKGNDKSKSKMYKYIFIGLVIVLLIVLGLWWYGYLYKLPFLNKFAPSPSPVEKYPITQYPIIQQPLPQVQPQVQVRPDIPLPKLPQPLHIPTPNVIVSEPQQYIPDSNFINEMRELKIDI